ncbi:uncharacterized protein DFL_007471 [Arthrobotrys flagrans]|uniref:Uncharacterized protein n=1 Tax=Arthrobotrys flagrans TaxID=97331 RepID=A0A436ZVW4_ARTFL|nr:hypothetical protein DFL_007471 [Arthrobotrys flagrans]
MMIYSTLFSVILSAGLLGLQTTAKPLIDLDGIAPAAPLRDDTFENAILKRNIDLSSLDDIPPAEPIREDGLRRRDLMSAKQKRSISEAMDRAIEMKPIREDDLTPQHLLKREDPLSRLDLRKDVTMIYGGAAVQQQMYLANVTLHAPDPDHPLIMMEKFDGLTTSLECASKTQMKIKFKSKPAMDHAIAAWKWVNSEEDDYFYLIANHPTCCPSSQRAPYKVTGVKIDEKGLESTLTIGKTPWTEVAGNFDLTLGRYDIPSRARRHFEPAALTKRFFGLDSLAVKLISFLGVAPDISSLKSIFVNLATAQRRVELFRDRFHEDPYLQINCIECGSHGGIELGIRAKAENGEVKNLGLFLQPRGLAAKLELEVKAQATMANPISLTKSILPDTTIPGFSIPYLFTFGPSIQFNAGFDLKLDAIANFTIGVEAVMPDSAMIVVDVVARKSGVSGLQGARVAPLFRINDLAARGEAGAFIGPSLAFGAKILNTFKYEGALQLNMPYVGAELHAGYNKNGFCPKANTTEKQKITTGVKGKLNANIELWFKLGSQGGLVPVPNWIPTLERKIWGQEHPFEEFCVPYWIPGLQNGAKPPPPSKTLELTGDITKYKTRTFSAETTAPLAAVTIIQGPEITRAMTTSAIAMPTFKYSNSTTTTEAIDPIVEPSLTATSTPSPTDEIYIAPASTPTPDDGNKNDFFDGTFNPDDGDIPFIDEDED